MAKRIAYVGLSSPIFYDYSRLGKPSENEMDSPNPILDGSFGLFMLFDEIWFISRNLCPQNLRRAPFVRFLFEEGRLPNLSQIQIAKPETVFTGKQRRTYSNFYRKYREAVKHVGIHWNARPDNH